MLVSFGLLGLLELVASARRLEAYLSGEPLGDVTFPWFLVNRV